MFRLFRGNRWSRVERFRAFRVWRQFASVSTPRSPLRFTFRVGSVPANDDRSGGNAGDMVRW